MNLLTVLLQAVSAEIQAPEVAPAQAESYFDLLLKGGWILVPLFLLSLVSIYVIISKVIQLNRLRPKDSVWFSRVWELVQEQKFDKAIKFSQNRPFPSARVIAAGLKEVNNDEKTIEDAMQTEARQQISDMEYQMNYLGITAAIAPMLGFLGTIFGVITIFYNISVTGDLEIATISDGLYQKMINSGVGLFVGIIAYTGYYLLNGVIDRIILAMDKDANQVMKAIRAYQRGEKPAPESSEDFD